MAKAPKSKPKAKSKLKSKIKFKPKSEFFFEQWSFWRNSMVIALALFLGWVAGGGSQDPKADPIIAENRQLKLQMQNLNAQLSDYQSLKQVQQEALEKLKAGNQELQDKLATLEQDLHKYRDLLEERNTPM